MDRDSINKHYITAKRLSSLVKDGNYSIQDAVQKLYDVTFEVSSVNKGNKSHYEFMIALVVTSMTAMGSQIDKDSMFNKLFLEGLISCFLRYANRLYSSSIAIRAPFNICRLSAPVPLLSFDYHSHLDSEYVIHGSLINYT
jgi:hypothetical protein